jgi:hypothetical protein
VSRPAVNCDDDRRELGTGLFRLGGIGIYNAKSGVGSINQAALVQMFALLNTPPEHLRM